MQTDPGAFHRATNCLFVSQPVVLLSVVGKEITACPHKSGCGNLATLCGNKGEHDKQKCVK